MFIRIQTNRAKLKKIISSFGRNAVANESLIAQRPLPKELFKYYVAFASVSEGSKNQKLLQSIKNHKIITNSEYDKEVAAIKYFWNAGDKIV